MYMLSSGEGTSRCRLDGDGATSPMVKRACKRRSNCYGKSNVNKTNENSTRSTKRAICNQMILGLVGEASIQNIEI
jgi:hypothetical protein